METGTGAFTDYIANAGILFANVGWNCAANALTVANLARGIDAARRHPNVVVVVQEAWPEAHWTAYLIGEKDVFNAETPPTAHISVWYHD